MRRIEYRKGQKLGNLIYLMDTTLHIKPSGGEFRKAMFMCICGKEFETSIDRAKALGVKSCGCLSIKNPSNLIHGLCNNKLHKVWIGMKGRCYCTSNPKYHRYGARGIKVCAEWRNDFKAYYDYVTSLPNAMQLGLTLDRRNNNEDYKPRNMRWADAHTQAMNRKYKKGKSGYIGITFHKRDKVWVSRISFRNKRYRLGRFNSKVDAVNARNNFIIENELWEYPIQSI